MLKKTIILLIAVVVMNMAMAQSKHSPTSKFKSYKGLVMAGYQGWHNTPEDGSGRGWGHYLERGTGEFRDGNLKIDMWPTVSEYKQLYSTPFKNSDGSVALLPSANDASTTDVRFKWMKQYGVDGVFLQRFTGNTRKTPANAANRNHFLKVMGDAISASRKYGRAIGVMYDLSGSRDNDFPGLIEDWKMLVDSMKVTSGGNKQTYLYHNGKPLVVLWGVGFGDRGRNYTLAGIEKFIDFLQTDSVYGGCSIMLGVPTYWRELGRDTAKDPHLLNVIKKAGMIHPWTIGRYGSEEAFRTYTETQKGDFEWARQNKVDYVPTVFPGFSWHNLNPTDKFDRIPRNRGKFYWNQLQHAIKSGAEMIYVAMYDEVDEGTAIMKVSKTPPTGKSPFLKFEEGIPSDYYLYLTGQAGKMLKKKIPFSEKIPLPKNAEKSK